MTNGGGPAVMATDALVQAGGKLATLSDDAIAQLDRALPANWSRANPVDIVGDAPVERYTKTLQTLVAEPAPMQCCSCTLRPRSSLPATLRRRVRQSQAGGQHSARFFRVGSEAMRWNRRDAHSNPWAFPPTPRRSKE